MAQSTHTVSGDFDLATVELRVVARYVVRHAEDVLSVYEQAVPGDPRLRAAIDATWAFMALPDSCEGFECPYPTIGVPGWAVRAGVVRTTGPAGRLAIRDGALAHT
jgi:hypothetical protein